MPLVLIKLSGGLIYMYDPLFLWPLIAKGQTNITVGSHSHCDLLKTTLTMSSQLIVSLSSYMYMYNVHGSRDDPECQPSMRNKHVHRTLILTKVST